MKRRPPIPETRRRTGLVLAIGALLLGTAAALPAAEQHVTSRVHARLVTVREDVEAGNLDRALSHCQALLATTPDKPYDLAMVRQALAHIHIARGELAPAVPMIRAVLEGAVLEPERNRALRRTLGRILIGLGQMAPGARELERWRREGGVAEEGDQLALAQAYLALERYADAVRILTPLTKAHGAPTVWIEALLGAWHARGDLDASIAIAARLLAREPGERRRWHTLAALYEQASRPRDALATLALAERRGILSKPREILDVVARYLRAGAPFDAGRVLERALAKGAIAEGVKNRQRLAGAWIAAGEWDRAIAALEAIPLAERSAAVRLRMARLAFERRDWMRTAEHASSALNKALPPEEAGVAQVLLGVSRHRLGHDGAARAAFAVVARGGGDAARTGAEWLSYTEANIRGPDRHDPVQDDRDHRGHE